MPDIQQPATVESKGDYVCILYRDPEEFETVRTPDWARKAAESVVAGSQVRVGKRADRRNWIPQEVLVPEPVDTTDACRYADEILQRIDY